MSDILSLDINSKFVSYDLSSELLKRFGTDVPVVVCLGSDKVLSDMVGVFVADMLKAKNLQSFVFGGSDIPIMEKNLDVLLKKIVGRQVLFVDSGICKREGGIFYSSDGIILASGKKYFGASISAGTIKTKNGKILLASTRLGDVLKYASLIAQSIEDYFSYVYTLNNKHYL
jgi:hypothetical protein